MFNGLRYMVGRLSEFSSTEWTHMPMSAQDWTLPSLTQITCFVNLETWQELRWVLCLYIYVTHRYLSACKQVPHKQFLFELLVLYVLNDWFVCFACLRRYSFRWRGNYSLPCDPRGPYLLAFPMMVMETISCSNRITQWICVVTETACFVWDGYWMFKYNINVRFQNVNIDH